MSLPARAPRIPAGLVLIGKLGAPHGVAGELRLFSLSDVPGRFRGLAGAVWIGAQGQTRELKIKSLRAAAGHDLVAFAGWDRRETAAELSNGLLAVPESERAAAPAGTYFVDEIIGLEVVDERGESLGRVQDIFQTGANDVYVVQGPRGELMLPALKSIILAIDLPGRRLVARVPEGLDA